MQICWRSSSFFKRLLLRLQQSFSLEFHRYRYTDTDRQYCQRRNAEDVSVTFDLVSVVQVLLKGNKGIPVYFWLFSRSCCIEPLNSKWALTHHQQSKGVWHPCTCPLPSPCGCSTDAAVNITIITAGFVVQGFGRCEVKQHCQCKDG